MNADVIVVGAGGGGPVVAKELAERGIRVLMLEAGPWLDPDRDYTLLEDDMSALGDGRLRWGPGDRSKAPWVRRRDGVGLIRQLAGVGGTTQHYNGISARPYPSAIDGHWPVSYADLVPYFERVEEFLPVTMVADLATKDALFAAGCEAVGLPKSESKDVDARAVWRPTYNAILPIAKMIPDGPLTYPEVDGCTMCGRCIEGCPNPAGAPLERKAKRSTNVSYVPAAMATGSCELVPDAFATAVLFEAGGSERSARVRGVRWRSTESGETSEAEAPVVVLAGGAIESPRLWLNSGLPNGGDVVGRYLTMHLQDFVTGIFDREVRPDVGQVTMARADFPGQAGTLFTQGVGPQSFALIMNAGTGFWDQPVAGEPWDTVGRGWGETAARRVAEYPRSLTLVVCTDDEEVPENRVTIADDWGPDENGPVPKVTYHPTSRSVERQDWLARKGAEILRAAGARTVHRTNVQPAYFTHIMGTLRMGEDPATSVVDAGCESHEVGGLFVGDSASLVNGLGGPNPTLTLQALAARTADQIALRYFA